MKRIASLGDFILTGILILLSFAFFLIPTRSKGNTVIVKQDGKIVYQGSLFTEQTIQIDGLYHNTILIKDGTAKYLSSTCPNKDCVHRGEISSANETAACAPNHTIILIRSEESEVDAIAN